MPYRQRTEQAKVRIRATVTETVVLQKEVEFELDGDIANVEDEIKDAAYWKTIYEGPNHGWVGIDGSIDLIEWEVIGE